MGDAGHVSGVSVKGVGMNGDADACGRGGFPGGGMMGEG